MTAFAIETPKQPEQYIKNISVFSVGLALFFVLVGIGEDEVSVAGVIPGLIYLGLAIWLYRYKSPAAVVSILIFLSLLFLGNVVVGQWYAGIVPLLGFVWMYLAAYKAATWLQASKSQSVNSHLKSEAQNRLADERTRPEPLIFGLVRQNVLVAWLMYGGVAIIAVILIIVIVLRLLGIPMSSEIRSVN